MYSCSLETIALDEFCSPEMYPRPTIRDNIFAASLGSNRSITLDFTRTKKPCAEDIVACAGLAATTPPIKLVPASVGFSQAGPSAAPVTLGSGTPSAFAAVSATVEAASPAYGKPEEVCTPDLQRKTSGL